MADPPSLNRELKEIAEDTSKVEVDHPPVRQSLLELLSSPNIASKQWVYKQYDHEVQVRTVVKPGDDAAVLRIDDDTVDVGVDKEKLTDTEIAQIEDTIKRKTGLPADKIRITPFKKSSK